jgi:hypothetical protein
MAKEEQTFPVEISWFEGFFWMPDYSGMTVLSFRKGVNGEARS